MSDSDSEDERPPPLADVSAQVAAARTRRAGAGGGGGAGAGGPGGRGGASEAPGAPEAPAGKPKAIKRGFFDAPKRKKKAGGKGRREAPVAVKVKAKPAGGLGGRAGPAIPDFLKVEVEEDKMARQFKEKLTTAMKPNPGMMKNHVMNNPALMAGFDDPEVMAAVTEISQNPQAMAKHQSNPKVVKFYQSMAQMMADRCDELAEAEEGAGGGGPPPPRPRPTAAVPLATASGGTADATIEEIGPAPGGAEGGARGTAAKAEKKAKKPLIQMLDDLD